MDQNLDQNTDQTVGQNSDQNSSASGAKTLALTQGRGGILGVKAGMTQVYNDDGDALAVTVIDLRPNVITQVKTKEKEGYTAVQVGVQEKKARSVNKSEAGHAKKSGNTGFYHYEEIRLPEGAKLEGAQAGMTLSPEFLKEGDLVDVIAISKGKGFQGVMKKYHYSGNYKSHGASLSHRSIGSIGNRADPGKVFKGKPMAGQMGNIRVTLQNVKVVRIDRENNLLLVHGSVPGPKSGMVRVQKAVKKLGQKVKA